MAITYNFKLDMTPGGVPPVVHLSQYDSDFTLVFDIYTSKGQSFSITSGTTAKIQGTKKDGNGYMASGTVNVTNKTVTITGDEQMTAVAGRTPFEISLTYNSKVISTANFILDIEKAPLSRDTVSSDSSILEFYDIADQVEAILEAFNAFYFDTTPTENSTKAVTSGGIYDALNNIENIVVTDPQSDGNIIIAFT